MQAIVRGVIGLVGALAILVAAAIWADPGAVAARLGLLAPEPLGMASVRADLGGFFGAAGLLSVAATLQNRARLLTAPLLMLALALSARLASVAIHGLEPGMLELIGVEVGLVALLVLGRRTLAAA